MAEHKQYYIHIPGSLVEVSESVYFAYYQEKRRNRTLEEKDERNGTVSMTAWTRQSCLARR